MLSKLVLPIIKLCRVKWNDRIEPPSSIAMQQRSIGGREESGIKLIQEILRFCRAVERCAFMGACYVRHPEYSDVADGRNRSEETI